MREQSLELHHPDLFSQIRRTLNAMREKQVAVRRQAIGDFLRMVRTEQLPAGSFDEIMMMSNKDLLKNLSDSSEYNREHSLLALIDLLQRTSRLAPYLPYIFAALIDRTNCADLEGTASLPEQLMPAPGQKPKVLVRLVEQCEEIRVGYVKLMRVVLSLVEEGEIRERLDEIVNILRALIMDPAPEVQRLACETLEFFCRSFKMVLLHYTEIMGRAVLLPLVSKKSKIRIAGLNALTSVLWCGLWKYNAFVFQNLIGFRDPNSVPIKDFYEPSNNINYFATFVNDQNVKVRQEFMRHLRIWTCDLDDKYDHHGRLVPYILSGLFDPDPTVRDTAAGLIEEVGRQMEVQKEKEFREGKQYAIDAAWVWQGKLSGLRVEAPLKGRPSLGSRVFVRGHVRKFWAALYKEIKDISFQNRIRAVRLMLFGTIFTQNYMTQYLDVMLPHLLSSILPLSPEDAPVANTVYQILSYIGRYCEVSAYLHIIASALKGELIQNEDFLRASLKGLAALIGGAFEAIPEGTGLCHKKQQVEQLLALIEQCSLCSEVYASNAAEGMAVVEALLNGLKSKANAQQQADIMANYALPLIKLLAVSYYELTYSHLLTSKRQEPSPQEYASLKGRFDLVGHLHPEYFTVLEDYMREAYMSPPAVMDGEWKLVVVIHNLLSQAGGEAEALVFQLCQEVIGESLTLNRSLEILAFLFRYVHYLFEQVPNKQHLARLPLVLVRAFQNFHRFKPMRKVPVYDQHLVKPETDPSVIRINEDQFLPLYGDASRMLQAFYLHRVPLPAAELGTVLHFYLSISSKFVRDKSVASESVRTLWVVFQRAEINEKWLQFMKYEEKGETHPVFEQITDFLVERLETMGDPDTQRVSMIFDCLLRVAHCCPKIKDASVKLPHFYPAYPYLLEKLFKYALDEKDQGVKQKYKQLLVALCRKLRPWFEVQARQSEEGQRFARFNLLSWVLQRVSS